MWKTTRGGGGTNPLGDGAPEFAIAAADGGNLHALVSPGTVRMELSMSLRRPGIALNSTHNSVSGRGTELPWNRKMPSSTGCTLGARSAVRHSWIRECNAGGGSVSPLVGEDSRKSSVVSTLGFSRTAFRFEMLVMRLRFGSGFDSRYRGNGGRRVRHVNSQARAHIGRWALSSTTRTDSQSLEEAAPASSGTWEEAKSDELPGSDSPGSDSYSASTGEISSSSSSTIQVESKQQQQQPAKGVFPGGVRRAEVRIPGLVLRVQVLEVLEGKGGSEGFLVALSSAVAEGLTMVILESGVAGEGGARLYEAACVLKSILRGRAELLVTERVDIAAAAGADGVVLSDDGLPAVVARRMMQNAVSESAVLPLVARTVSSAQSARSATALEGADFLLLQCPNTEELSSYVRKVCKEVSIPVFLDVTGWDSHKKDTGIGEALDLVQAGASGVILSAAMMMDTEDVSSYVAAVSSAMALARQEQRNGNDIQSGKVSSAGFWGVESQKGSLPIIERSPEVALDIDEQAKLFLEEERKLLTAMVDFVRAASPEMEEISLLRDALKQLDELFLLVVVGEFNSGKSSVINALLGQRFLKEGVLPTTNEITLLRHSGDGNDGEERSAKHPDGHLLRYIPAELLTKMNLVDTPGTNVILQRQQRLTEEFVPRADLVLFVLSVDRALTESEVTFLRYIRQWGKKIIFILNKADVLSQRSELDEVIAFVKENAQSLLGVEEAVVYPVSARRAIRAKSAVTTEAGVLNKEVLQEDSYWKSSGFGELENFIVNFLEGSSDAGAERLRLKLDTPLGIGMALLSASDRQLAGDIVKVDTDLRVLAQIDEQLVQYQEAVQADADLQRQRTIEVVAAAKSRAGKFVDSILRLSNIEDMLKYLLGSDGAGVLPVSRGFNKQVIGSAISDVQKVLDEQVAWLLSNSERQTNTYLELLRNRWPDWTSATIVATTNGSQSFQSYKEDRQKTDSKSAEVLEGFDVRAAEILLEQEIREAVLSTFGGLGVAGVSASVLTSILPNTLEDLLALAVCSAGGFVGVWNLPSRRQDIKIKINRVADNIGRKLGEAMQTDLQQNLDQLRLDIISLTAPYRKSAEAERARVIALQRQLGELDSQLRNLRQRVQNIGI